MPHNPRVTVKKIKGGMGATSYDVYVDGEYVGNMRLKKEAVQLGESHIASKQEADRQLGEYINEIYEDEC